MTQRIKKLVWIDLEMTGLDPREDKIVEIATVVTDTELSIEGEQGSVVVHQPQEILNTMSSRVEKTFIESGLYDEILDSNIRLGQAEDMTIEFLKKYINRRESPLCGSTIAQDRAFLQIHMPRLFEFLHYRVIDVSSVMQLYHMWKPNGPGFATNDIHRAYDDIKESIEALKFYRKQFLKVDLPEDTN